VNKLLYSSCSIGLRYSVARSLGPRELFMGTDGFSTNELSRKIRNITGDVRAAVKRETGSDYDESVIEDAIRSFVVNSLDRIRESLPEMFTSPERREFQELTWILADRQAAIPAVAEDMAHTVQPATVFAGNRRFAKEKLAAMIEYLTGKGHHVYKTSLNKLLFYSDLTYFYLRGQGMSGAVYYNRPFGPVAEFAQPVLTELIEAENVKILPRTQTLEASKVEHIGLLTNEERKVLDWVADTYGSMTASAISELSHSEKAYKFSGPNNPIAYAYASYLKHLPSEDLLEK
jgi:uncharacterized phage-associated protein